MVPVNVELYSLDLLKANKYDKPEWKKEFDYLSSYKLKDLSPRSMVALSEKLYIDMDL